jgi:pilus assembly protein CpaB
MRRRILIMLAALVLAGLSGVSMMLYARGLDQRALDGRRPVTVLLADKPIRAGTTGRQIRENGLAHSVVMPAETVPEGALRSVTADIDPLRISADLAPQQIVMRGLFGTGGAQGTAAVGVPEGQLGVSVAVAMAPGVAEKVAAGDKVAVFLTYPRSGQPDNQKTRVLLPSATVISITTGQPSDTSASPSPSSTSRRSASASRRDTYPATLAVSQADATRLVHAAQTGLIYLGLLGAETKVTSSTAVDLDSLWPKGDS